MSAAPPSAAAAAEVVDAIIVGSGQAGNPLAVALAKAGKRTVVIEDRAVGGTCVNYGCTPTKTMISSARAAYDARRAPEYGVHTGPVTVNLTEVRARKRSIVDLWRTGSEKSLASQPLIELVRGLGRFTAPRTVEVSLHAGATRTFAAPWIFLNTGLSSWKPPVACLEQIPYLTNESVMELEQVPEHLLVLGGSYIACEFGQMFRRFGAQVTLISTDHQLLPHEDPDIAEELAKIFAADAIEFIPNATAETAEMTENGSLALGLKLKNGAIRQVSGTHLLLAAGRHPNTPALNLQAAGIETDEHGFIRANERLETTAEGVWALGDVKGGPAFTHISYDDYRILEANLLNGGHRTTNDRPIPYTVFTDPELGRIGLSEHEARATGRNIRVAKMPATSIARAYETNNMRGLMKVIVDGDTEEILGAAVLTSEGGELASMFQLAMAGKLPYTYLRDGVFSHPTWSESLNTIFSHWVD